MTATSHDVLTIEEWNVRMADMHFRLHRRGFTLLELLLVIGLIGTLASIVLVALNPQKQFASARDADRLFGVKQLQSALYQYAIKNAGLPNDASIPTTAASALPICRQVITNAACLNMDALVSQGFIASIPQDASETNLAYSGFKIYKLGTQPQIVASNMGQASVATQLAQGLIGYWPFDETTGSVAADASGGGHPGTIIGTPVHSSNVPPLYFSDPMSLQFDKTNYVTTGTLLSGNAPFTAAAWVNPAEITSGWKGVFGEGCTGFDLSIDRSSVKVGRNCASPGGVFYVATTVQANLWTHVAMTFDGTNVNAFVNGVKYPGGPVTYSHALVTIASYQGGGEPFNGNIDDVRVYNRVLSDGEIASLAGGAN